MIIGRLYFRLTASGNLIGEFSNQISTGNTTESADRITGHSSTFIGDFRSTWLDDNEPVFATLRIQAKEGTINIFSLSWQINGSQSFVGEAIVVDGLLIGDYRDMEAHSSTLR